MGTARWVISGTFLLAALTQGAAADKPAPPVRLAPGPHLLLDDALIESSAGLTRKVNQPKRDLTGPVVTGKEDKNFQPYVTVVRDPQSRRFRMWYDVPENAGRSHLGYLESSDGVNWESPHRVLTDPAPIQFGASILDEGPAFSEPAKRFKFGWWQGGGLQVAASADGLAWKPLAQGVVLPHNHDINCIFRDPVRKRYVAMISSYTTGDAWKGKRRVTMQSVSDDLVRWQKPWAVITPDDAKDEGETQFYCMGGLLARGGTLVGLLKVLRDDLPADPDGPRAGIGYTVLAWSHDGEHWQRDREPFLDRNPKKESWDHAMTWGDCQLPVGDEVFLYYGGYARGHKVERFTERQIGLVRFPRDRYVAREAGDAAAKLRTPLLVIEGAGLALNVDARGGDVRAQLLGADDKPIPGFTFADCEPLTTDGLSLPLRWKKPLTALERRPGRLELSLKHARLFALEVQR